tara:strand:+ start:6532 stop:7956 length:1425 start_codon:yes stop_codon:yes gene_type:complete
MKNNFKALIFLLFFFYLSCEKKNKTELPNIILLMTDDQGWGQTGYYNHPVLKTPNLDKMAKNGLRLDRFYAGAPQCSPTRASVLTGRSNDRTGVFYHGYPLNKNEKTIAQALKAAGYKTGHFGKWHLNGLRGPGVPILKDDKYSPGIFGFDKWLSVTNFFDIDPVMSYNGEFQEFQGSSSEIIVDEALKFIKENKDKNIPSFTVIWDGSPHTPMLASQEDRIEFKGLELRSQHHYGELVAFDRSLGLLRKELKELGISDNTILWFCSDNGGLDRISPSTVGELKGFKNTMWEGGLRVPAIIEWPLGIKSKVSSYPASTMDIVPTILDIVGISHSKMLKPIDGISLKPLFNSQIKKRVLKIPFRFDDRGAMIDNDIKLIVRSIKKSEFELYDLAIDPKESTDIKDENPFIFKMIKKDYLDWIVSVEKSIEGNDYKNPKVYNDSFPKVWNKDERYRPYFNEWSKRPEYKNWIKKIN